MTMNSNKTPIQRYGRARGATGIQTKLVRGQEGAILILSLVVLVAMTIAVMAMVNLSSSQFMVINGMAEQKELESVAREGIEIVMNNQSVFANKVTGAAGTLAGVSYSPTQQTVVLPTNMTPGYQVTLQIPFCYGAKTAVGYSALSAVAPEDTHWEIISTAKSLNTGGQMTVVEGVKIRLGAGNCGQVL